MIVGELDEVRIDVRTRTPGVYVDPSKNYVIESIHKRPFIAANDVCVG